MFTHYHTAQEEENVVVHEAARQAFNRLHHQALFSQMIGKLRRRPASLQSLHTATRDFTMNSSRDDGAHTVRLDQIGGSVGRTHDFDQNFRPLKRHMRQRWTRVAYAFEAGIGLGAVELIQIGDRYFVMDGHHRVSVAKMRGQVEIDAQVHVWHGATQPAATPQQMDTAGLPKPFGSLKPILNGVHAVLHAVNMQLRTALQLRVQAQN